MFLTIAIIDSCCVRIFDRASTSLLYFMQVFMLLLLLLLRNWHDTANSRKNWCCFCNSVLKSYDLDDVWIETSYYFHMLIISIWLAMLISLALWSLNIEYFHLWRTDVWLVLKNVLNFSISIVAFTENVAIYSVIDSYRPIVVILHEGDCVFLSLV